MLKAATGASVRARVRETFVTDAGKRLSIRGAVFAGFALIFVLWLVAGIDLVRRLSEANAQTTAINTRLTRAEDLVSIVRSQILLSSITLRDALLDTPDNVSFYRAQLQDRRAAVEQALEQYEPVADSVGEREAIEGLRSKLRDFWRTRLAVVEWDAARRSVETMAFIRGASMPTREEVLRISAGVQQLHRASFVRQQADLSELHAAMRRRVWLTTGLALCLSASVALLVAVYAGRLELRIQQQRIQDLEKTRDLQRLSAKLVHAQEEERRTIARELHDEVGQALTAIKLELSAAEHASGLEPGRLGALDGVRTISDRALQSVRDLSHLLHPALLDDIGLSAALELQLRTFSARTGIRSEFLEDRSDGRLAPDLELCLYRVAQEAMTNVARHANASSCSVRLRRTSESVVMQVEDDGRGFSPESTNGSGECHGIGLLGIRERVTGLRGDFRLDSAPGHGTRLSVELPVMARVDAPDVDATGSTLPSTREENR